MKFYFFLFSVCFISLMVFYSCSAEEEESVAPVVQTPQPEPEPLEYTLTVSATEGGTVSTEGGTYEEGTEVTITASANEGYRFTGWEGNNSTNESLTITLNSNQTYQALFELIPIYTLTVTTSEGGTVSTEGGEYEEGTEVTITATPDEGYEFVGWTGAIESAELEVQLLVSEAKEVNAVFLKILSGTSESIQLCELENYHIERGVGLGYPRYDYSLKSVGNLKITLIFVDFDDEPASRNINDVYNYFNPVSSDFFSKSSYDKLNIEFEVIDKWYRMSKISSDYLSPPDGSSHHSYLSEALSLADKDYDFSTTDHFVVVTNPDAKHFVNGPAFQGNSYWNFQADGKIFYSSTNSGYDLNYWGGLWLNHEVLHNMGLPDLYNYGGDPTWHGFVGEFSIMGLISGFAPDLFAYEKWMLGWLDEAEIFCFENGNVVTDIIPLESYSEGSKMIILPISDMESLIIENRRALNLDQNIPDEGVLVYLVDTSILTGKGTIEIIPKDKSDEQKKNALLKKGDVLIYDNYQIEVLFNTEDFYRIEITKN